MRAEGAATAFRRTVGAALLGIGLCVSVVFQPRPAGAITAHTSTNRDCCTGTGPRRHPAGKHLAGAALDLVGVLLLGSAVTFAYQPG